VSLMTNVSPPFWTAYAGHTSLCADALIKVIRLRCGGVALLQAVAGSAGG